MQMLYIYIYIYIIHLILLHILNSMTKSLFIFLKEYPEIMKILQICTKKKNIYILQDKVKKTYSINKN